WKSQDIIYLVWKVRSSSTNNFSTCFFCILWQYFWIWICHRKNNRIFIHFLYHFGCKLSASRYANKDSCSVAYFLDCTFYFLWVRLLSNYFFYVIHSPWTTFINRSLGITHNNIRYTEIFKHFNNCHACCTSTIRNNFYVFKGFFS